MGCGLNFSGFLSTESNMLRRSPEDGEDRTGDDNDDDSDDDNDNNSHSPSDHTITRKLSDAMGITAPSC